MGNSFDQYKQPNAGSMPVGSIVQAPYNLTDTAWLPCDGRLVRRSLYPKLSACLPSIGTFTATSRTKAATPTGNGIANNGTLWVVSGAVGAANLYSSTDGITFTPRTTPALCNVRSILHDGTNFVAANAVAGAMQYSANGTAWSTSATATVAAVATAVQTCMTWASSLGTVGRFCLAISNTQVYTSDDRGVTWTQRTTGITGVIDHVCWTGQKFIATTETSQLLHTSTDGITWTSQTMPFTTNSSSPSLGAIISDGNGLVLWADGNSNLIYTSVNHGVDWTQRQFSLPSGVINLTGSVVPSYTNGRFFLTSSTSGTWSSIDLVGWLNTDIPNAVTFGSTINYKAGVYLVNANASTPAAYTLTEDTTYLRLPYGGQNSVSTTTWNNFMPFIKVQ
jgi:hypothetical protein